MRISIMVGGSSSRPDTLKQTGSAANLDNPLADGAGHTFLPHSAHQSPVLIATLNRSGLRPSFLPPLLWTRS